MDDQVSALKQNKVSAERLHSHMTDTENKVWDSFCNGNIKILYMSPEALMSSSKLEVIKTLDIELFVIDEAHCISKWGPGFRKDYEALSQLKVKFFLMQTYQLLQQPQIKQHVKILWKN